MITRAVSAEAFNDAELVGKSLAGNRDAFGQIIARYQSLVCSLAYSATGSLSQSEDLAQETFVAAWQQLADLRDLQSPPSQRNRILLALRPDCGRHVNRDVVGWKTGWALEHDALKNLAECGWGRAKPTWVLRLLSIAGRCHRSVLPLIFMLGWTWLCWLTHTPSWPSTLFSHTQLFCLVAQARLPGTGNAVFAAPMPRSLGHRAPRGRNAQPF